MGRRFWESFKNEWSLKNMKLGYHEPQLFLIPEWHMGGRRGVELSYVIYRWFWVLYHTAWWAVSFASEGGYTAPIKRKPYYFIYLTNWSYMTIVVMNITQATIVLLEYLQQRQNPSPPKTMKKRLKVLWAMQNMVYLPALLITCAYWLIIYDPEVSVSPVNAEVHIVNAVYVIIDLMVVASPVRILHFYIPLLYLFVYASFTLIYWGAGGLTPEGLTAIYPILDWENLGVTMPFVVGCTICSPLMQGVVWLIFMCRRMLYDLCRKDRAASLPHENTMDVIMARDASTDSVAAGANPAGNILRV